MKVHRPPIYYPSVDAFYAELPDVDRRLSVEHDLGVHWTQPGEPRGPSYRMSLVLNTHELVIVQLDARHSRSGWGIRASGQGELRVLATFDDNQQAERALEGWEHHCGSEGLRWVRRTLDACLPDYYCTLCSATGFAEITHDPEEWCSRCRRRSWEQTPDSKMRADFRRRVFGTAGATSARSTT